MAGYLANHRRCARACKRRAGDCCEACGQPNRVIGTNSSGQPVMEFLHAAHAHHDRANPDAAYICLCPKCHRLYDEVHRKALQRLNATLQAEIVRAPTLLTAEKEQAFLAMLAQLQAQEQADFATWQATDGSDLGEQEVLQQRAHWARCKRLRLELHLARLVVAHLYHRPPLAANTRRQLQEYFRLKRDRYLLAIEAYQRVTGQDLAQQVSVARGKEKTHDGTL